MLVVKDSAQYLESVDSPGLSPFLDSVVDGSDEDIRTPFWNKIDREEVLSRWDSIFDSNLDKLPGRLGSIDKEQREKVGPLSIRAPLSERLDHIRGYWTEFLDDIPDQEENFTNAFELLGRHSRRMRPLSLEAAVGHLPGDTNSGLPRFTRKSKVREAELVDATRGLVPPAILFWRGQSGGPNPDDVKQRDILGFPMSVSIREAAFMRVYFEVIRSNESFSAWTTPEGVASSVAKLLEYAHERESIVHSTDFSGYDQSVGPVLTAPAWSLIRRSFQMTYEEELLELESIFHNIELLVSKRMLFSGTHGVPSGSTFTNLIDTLVHLIAQFHVCSKLGVLRYSGCQVQGDDGLLVLPPTIKVEEMHDGYAELGLDSNPDKAFEGYDDCLYLQRYYKRGIQGGMYPSYRALNSLLGQERFYDEDEWGADMVVLRAIMILENCKHHPLFSDLVKFVMAGDRYRLGADWPGGIDSLIRKGVPRAKSISNFVPSYNQEDRLGGIQNFAAYNIIKEM